MVSERDEEAHLQGRPGGFLSRYVPAFPGQRLKRALPVSWLFVLAGCQVSHVSKKHPRLPAQPWLRAGMARCLMYWEGNRSPFSSVGPLFQKSFRSVLWALPVAFQANTALSALTSILLKRL